MKITAVVGIVDFEGKILIGKKASNKGILKNAWHVPGGKVNVNESDEEALIREIKEETGIKIVVKELVDVKENFEKQILVKWFVCKATSDKIKPGSDLSDAKFVERKMVKTLCDPIAVSLWPPKVKTYFDKDK